MDRQTPVRADLNRLIADALTLADRLGEIDAGIHLNNARLAMRPAVRARTEREPLSAASRAAATSSDLFPPL